MNYGNFNSFTQNIGGENLINRNTSKPARMTQPLTAEDIANLKKKPNTFSFTVSAEEAKLNQCTHKYNDKFTISEIGDGTMCCSICGARFELIKDSKEEVTRKCQDVINVIQTIKSLYLDIPLEFVGTISSMLPILKLLPRLYELATDNFEQYQRGDNSIYSSSDENAFDILNSISPVGGFNNSNTYYQEQPNNNNMANELAEIRRQLQEMSAGKNNNQANPFTTNTSVVPNSNPPQKNGQQEVVSVKSFNA